MGTSTIAYPPASFATIGATPAVHSAVLDALAPEGVRHVDLPANGENVWRAIQEAKS